MKIRILILYEKKNKTNKTQIAGFIWGCSAEYQDPISLLFSCLPGPPSSQREHHHSSNFLSGMAATASLTWKETNTPCPPGDAGRLLTSASLSHPQQALFVKNAEDLFHPGAEWVISIPSILP